MQRPVICFNLVIKPSSTLVITAANPQYTMCKVSTCFNEILHFSLCLVIIFRLKLSHSWTKYWWDQMHCGPPNQNFGWDMVHLANPAAPPCQRLRSAHRRQLDVPRHQRSTLAVAHFLSPDQSSGTRFQPNWETTLKTVVLGSHWKHCFSASTSVPSALEAYLYTTMRYINWRFTYILTYLLTWLSTRSPHHIGRLRFISRPAKIRSLS